MSAYNQTRASVEEIARMYWQNAQSDPDRRNWIIPWTEMERRDTLATVRAVLEAIEITDEAWDD